uniref:guanylate cyclase n=1 Tax=Timema monikensis TaxID=170555 RepID=A0A7R9HIU5_9NEOP|nr:unnamed protein product [Timema monikensis]
MEYSGTARAHENIRREVSLQSKAPPKLGVSRTSSQQKIFVTKIFGTGQLHNREPVLYPTCGRVGSGAANLSDPSVSPFVGSQTREHCVRLSGRPPRERVCNRRRSNSKKIIKRLPLSSGGQSPGYRSKIPGFEPRRFQIFCKAGGPERSQLSFLEPGPVFTKYGNQDFKLKTDSDREKLPNDPDNTPHYLYLEEIYDCCTEADDVNPAEFLDELGQELMLTACSGGRLERAFRSLGGNLQDFLTTLDGVHDVLQDEAPRGSENGAAFVCAASSSGTIQLHFATEKRAVALLLVGSLRSIARLLYGTQTSINVVDGEQPNKYRYLIEPSVPSTESCSDNLGDVPTLSTHAGDLKMGMASFCKAFPWHFIVDRRLEMVQLGAGFMRLFARDLNNLGAYVGTYFEFKQPRGLALTFTEIVKKANTPFVLVIRRPDGAADFPAEGLELKGQMVLCPESDSILFVGSPFLDGLEGLTGRGLFISDIPLHDATRDVILVGEQARAQDGLRRRMDKLKSSIEEANMAVDKEREKNVSLLHLIFPPDIAKRLWLGETIEAKTHDNVTMLFSDIVGFTSICSTATPMMVINMLENLYNKFDEFCGQLDVYKVETIGDAYCVACGLHKRSSTHAQQIAWMALKMIETCSRHLTHDVNSKYLIL